VSSVFVAKHVRTDLANHRLSRIGSFVTNLSPRERIGKANSAPGRGTLTRRTSALLICVTNSVASIPATYAMKSILRADVHSWFFFAALSTKRFDSKQVGHPFERPIAR